MGHYTHLSMRDRCLINTFLEMKLSVREIAQRMGHHHSTIYREIERNIYYGYYMPAIAHEQAKQRHSVPPNKLDKNEELNKYVLERLQ